MTFILDDEVLKIEIACWIFQVLDSLQGQARWSSSIGELSALFPSNFIMMTIPFS